MLYTSGWIILISEYKVCLKNILKNKENKLVDQSDCFQAVDFKQLVKYFLAVTASHKSFSWFIKKINVKSITVFKNSPNISLPESLTLRATNATGRVGKTHRLDLNGKQKRVQMERAGKKDGFTSNQEEDLPAPLQEQTSKQSRHGHQLAKVLCLKMLSRCYSDFQLKDTNWREQQLKFHRMVKTPTETP